MIISFCPGVSWPVLSSVLPLPPNIYSVLNLLELTENLVLLLEDPGLLFLLLFLHNYLICSYFLELAKKKISVHGVFWPVPSSVWLFPPN